MTNLKNKIIFITGASTGIGKACAVQFAMQGANIILAARSSDKITALGDELQQKYNVKALPLVLDVSKRDNVIQTINELPEQWKNIDVLVNNAGLAVGKEKFQDADVDAFDTMINTNLKGLLYVTHTVLPMMIKCKSGHIINIGSTAGHETYPGGNVYCATKAAVRSISSALKKDLHGMPIRVTEIDPGAVETNFSVVRFNGDRSQADAVYKDMNPLVADDIADAVVYCASRPAHVNISEIVIYPTDQSSVQMIYRSSK